MSQSKYNYPPLSDEIREGYHIIVRHCLHPKLQMEAHEFINQLVDYSGDNEYFSTFNYVLEYFQKKKWYCFQYFDWKQDVQDLEHFIHSALTTHFETSIRLPYPLTYGTNASISSEGVFEDYDQKLRDIGLQLGCIDTDSDEYVLVIHRIDDIVEIAQAALDIGMDYYEF